MSAKRLCAFCGGDANAYGGRLGRLEGPYNAAKNTYEAVYVHHACAVWSPQISQDVALQFRSVGAEVRRARSLKCSSCGRGGAALGCRVPHCPRCYHLPCAIQQGCSFNAQLYLLACPNHAALFSNEPAAAGVAADTSSSGPLAHLKLAGKRSRQPQHYLRHEASGAAAGGAAGAVRRRNHLTAAQLGQHVDKAKAAFVSLAQELGAGESSEDDEAVIAAKDAKRLRKALQQLAPTILQAAAPGKEAAGRALQPPQQQGQQQGLQQGLPVGHAELVRPSGGFSRLGGLVSVKRQLRELVLLPLSQPHLAQHLGIQIPSGILLHGPPGAGKTALVRALAAECAALMQQQQQPGPGSSASRAVALFARKGTDCLGKYAGDAEQHLRLLFDMARRAAPSIIFLDELDGLVPPRSLRSSSSDQIFASVVSVLLALMDGLTPRGQVLVIGATNRPDSIDPALRRPGRFDREVHVHLPSQQERHDILRVLTAAWDSPPSSQLMQQLVAATDGWAGADLQSLTAGALFAAVRRLPSILTAAGAGCQPASTLHQHQQQQQLPAEEGDEPDGGISNGLDEGTPDAAGQVVAAGGVTAVLLQQELVHQDVDTTGQPQAAAAAAAAAAVGAMAQQQRHPCDSRSPPGDSFLAALADFVTEQQQPWLQPTACSSAAAAAVAATDEHKQERQKNEQQEQQQEQQQAQPPEQQQEQQQAQPPEQQQEQQQEEEQQLEQQQEQQVQQQQQQHIPVVLPCDWEAALAAAGPPCSKRELSSLAASNPAAPLPWVLTPLLLPAFAKLVIKLQQWLLLLPPGAAADEVLAQAAAAAAGASGAAVTAAADAVVAGSADSSSACSAFEQQLVQLGAVEPALEGHDDVRSHDVTHGSHSSSTLITDGMLGTASQVTPGSRQPHCLLLSGHGAVGQAELAAAVLQLLGHCLGTAASVHTLSLPGMLLAGNGSTSAGLAVGLRRLVASAGKSQLLVLHLPRVELWVVEPTKTTQGQSLLSASAAAGVGSSRHQDQHQQQQHCGPLADAGESRLLPGRGSRCFGRGSIRTQQGVFSSSSSSSEDDTLTEDDSSDDDGGDDGDGDNDNDGMNNAQAPDAAVESSDLPGSSMQHRPLHNRRRQRPGQQQQQQQPRPKQQQQWRLSSAWSVFEQQVALLAGRPVLLLATSNLAAEQLPLDMQLLFGWSAHAEVKQQLHQHPVGGCSSAVVQVCCVRSSSSSSSSSSSRTSTSRCCVGSAGLGADSQRRALSDALDRALLVASAQCNQAAALPSTPERCSSRPDDRWLPSCAGAAPAAPHQAAVQLPQAGTAAAAAASAAAGVQQSRPKVHFQQLNDANRARAQQLYRQVQLQLQQVGLTLLREPRVRLAAIKPRPGSSSSSSSSSSKKHSQHGPSARLQQVLPLAAVALKAVKGWYSRLEDFQADVAAAAASIRQSQKGRPGYSVAVAAAAALEDVVGQCCQVAAQQLQLYDPANSSLLQAACEAALQPPGQTRPLEFSPATDAAAVAAAAPASTPCAVSAAGAALGDGGAGGVAADKAGTAAQQHQLAAEAIHTRLKQLAAERETEFLQPRLSHPLWRGYQRGRERQGWATLSRTSKLAGPTCLFCGKDAEAKHVLLPCEHRALCFRCAADYLNCAGLCPTCLVVVTDACPDI